MGLKKAGPFYAIAKIDKVGRTHLRHLSLHSLDKRRAIKDACWELARHWPGGPTKQWKHLYQQGYRIITVDVYLKDLKPW